LLTYVLCDCGVIEKIEKFEDTKGIIRRCKSKKDRQYVSTCVMSNLWQMKPSTLISKWKLVVVL